MSKSANRLWREYRKAGGQLSFAAYINREKEKTFAASGENDSLFAIDKSLNDSVHNAIKETLAGGGLKTSNTGNTIFGINKTVFIAGSVLVVAATIYLLTRK